MTRAQLRLLCTLLFLEALVFGFFALPIRISSGDDVALPTVSANRALGPVGEGTEIRQQFSAPQGTLSSVSLYIATYMRQNTGVVTLSLEIADGAGGWRPLASQSIDPSQLRDNSFLTLTLQQPRYITPSQQLALTLRAIGPPGQGIAWWSSDTFAREGSSLSVNGQPQRGMAYFTIQYRSVEGPLWRVLGQVWQRITVFLNPAWQIVLLGGIGIGVFALLALFRQLAMLDGAKKETQL